VGHGGGAGPAGRGLCFYGIPVFLLNYSCIIWAEEKISIAGGGR
jgi:hypothetical protein